MGGEAESAGGGEQLPVARGQIQGGVEKECGNEHGAQRDAESGAAVYPERAEVGGCEGIDVVLTLFKGLG